MEKSEIVAMPVRQVKARQSVQQEGTDEDSSIRMFSMENVADRVFHRRKKGGVDEFEEEMAEGGPASEFRNQLAVLKDDSEDDQKLEDMDDWLKKLHIRTQHLIGKVTPAAMLRLAATNHVATAAIRLKGKYRLNETDDETGSPTSELHDSTSSLAEKAETPTDSPKEIEKVLHDSKDSSVRSKKVTKQSTEESRAPRRKKSGGKPVSDTKKTNKTPSVSAGHSEGEKKAKAKPTKSPRSSINKSTVH